MYLCEYSWIMSDHCALVSACARNGLRDCEQNKSWWKQMLYNGTKLDLVSLLSVHVAKELAL